MIRNLEGRAMPDFSTLMEQVQQKKEELRLRIHLGSMDLKQEWERLEAQWRELIAEAGLSETTKDVKGSLRLVAEELRKGYDKLETAVAAARARRSEEDRRQEVEELAHQLWEERGRPLGSPEEDWRRAEEILRKGEVASKG
jgi:hypothetical protein